MRWVVLVLLGLLGCSNSSPAADGGSDAQTEAGEGGGSPDAAPDAKLIARAAVKASYESDAGCSGAIVSIGTLPDTLVDDGATSTMIACSVHPNGMKFDVAVNITGMMGGLDLVGPLGASGTQMIDVMLRDAMGMPIAKMMCAGTYPTNGGVSAGKIWIKLTCMSSIDPPPMGCGVDVEVRAENCKP